jgi:oligoribonuclease NrnB/cAMP/cGMP phosphodiesterase (DHH superfamily)
MKPICLYHVDCVDGFGAVWAAWKKHGDSWEYVAEPFSKGTHDTSRYVGRDVYFLDLNFRPKVMAPILQAANKVTVLDHHIEGVEKLQALNESKLTIISDPSKSGATLSWDYFHGGTPPDAILYIEDQDLNRWKLPMSSVVFNAIASFPYSFESYDDLMSCSAERLVEEGQVAYRKYERDVQVLLDNYVHWVKFAGHKVPALNVPRMFNGAVSRLTDIYEVPFAIGYHMINAYQLKVSLRSNGFDVRTLAEVYGGGGGHPGAASFVVPLANAPQVLHPMEK